MKLSKQLHAVVECDNVLFSHVNINGEFRRGVWHQIWSDCSTADSERNVL